MKLQNPGTSAPKNLAFTTIPHLGEFFLHGGVPGVEYLYLLPEELPRAQDEGWSTIVRMPFFTINGVPFTAVAKGDPILGAAPGSSSCRCNMSTEGQRRIEQTGAVVTKPTTPPVDADAALTAAMAQQREKLAERQGTPKSK